ncbi:MAG: COX15/CtaA family protein [Pseudomonadota bacterium]|nr:COX15/CtaA family protein [Pseudomonadota bacterium]
MKQIESAAAVTRSGRKAVVIWLFTVAALIFLMVVIGGITRLTESGLSMVEWHPVTGWLPPLSEEAWQAEFAKYRNFPEYQKVNRGMSLEDFQAIYAWEYGHRLLGRIIGIVFFVPFVLFALSGRIRRDEIPWFAFLFVAGGAQGALGWFMVQSGLVDRPDVSQYRLCAHLLLAFIIYALIVWTAWRIREEGTGRIAVPEMNGFAVGLTALVLLQIALGAFVAGTNAGMVYTTWPLMDGKLVPDGLFAFDPAWLAPFEDHLTIQFLHRVNGYLLLAVGIWAWMAARKGNDDRARRTAGGIAHGILFQVAVGIVTLVLVVPVWLGAVHQATALLIWTAVLRLLFIARTDARGIR